MGPLYSAPVADIITLVLAIVMTASVLKKVRAMQPAEELERESLKSRGTVQTPA